MVLTALGPVVTRTALAEDEVVRAEKATKRTGADRVHGTGLQVDQDRARHVLVRADLVVVNRDALELLVVGALVETIGLDTVLVGDDFPELGTYATESASQRREPSTPLIPIWLPHCERKTRQPRCARCPRYTTHLAGLEVDDFTHAAGGRERAIWI